MYDIIVVGARCAGSPTAMLLARKGYRVLLVDKATFPSDAPRCHLIHAPGVARLKRWGLLDRVIASNCPPIGKMTFDLGPFAFVGSAPPIDGIDADYAPRRKVLDKILVDAAVEAGVELREGFSVQEVLMDGKRVTGICGHATGSQTITEMAPIIIGADGMRSIVARTVQAPTYHTKPTLTCGYYTYYSGVPIEGTEVYLRGPRFIGAFPTNDGLVGIAIYEFTCQLASLEPPPPEMQHLFAALRGNQVETNRFFGTVVGTVPIPEFFSPQNIERIVAGSSSLLPEQADRGEDAKSSLPHAA